MRVRDGFNGDHATLKACLLKSERRIGLTGPNDLCLFYYAYHEQ